MRSETAAIRRRSNRAAAAAWLLLLAPTPAFAQTAADPAGPTFLPRASFEFAWAHLTAADKRFEWQGQIGVDFDIVRVRRTRLLFRGAYEAFLGRERRLYDLNQSSYSFEAALGHSFGAIEIQGLLQHVSRHVVDRENVPSISWNLVGARVHGARSSTSGRDVAGSIEIGRHTQPAFVDYAWVTRARASMREPLTPRLALFGRASGEVIGVHRDVVPRPRVCGGRVEVAVRVAGRAADFEIYGSYERRIDAFPTDRFRVRWIAVGFRVIDK